MHNVRNSANMDNTNFDKISGEELNRKIDEILEEDDKLHSDL